jgi:two-component system sensor histidine kinase RegB
VSLRVKYGSRVLAAARAELATPDRWLVALRWLAILGMLATILGAKVVVPSLRLPPLFFTIGLIALLNFGWFLESRLMLAPRSVVIGIQIGLDVALLSAVLWRSGGLANPFSSFLNFQIVIAGMLSSPRATLIITGLALLAAGGLYFAPPLPLSDALISQERVHMVGHLVSLLALAVFLGFFVMLFQRRLEALRSETARHEKLAGLGRTVAAMCHELNTPLGTIVLAGRDLERIGQHGFDANAVPADVEELARTVVMSAERASNIIGLLRGSVAPNTPDQLIDAAAFTSDYVTRELDRLGFRGQRLLSLPASAPVRVMPLALGQILTNLVTNAVDAMRDIAEPRLLVEMLLRTETVELGISDNGPGVQSNFLPRVGEPFQTTKAEGTGLGLYVSTILAERMGGRLELESAAGRGTRLTLVLRRGIEARA